MTDRWTRLKEDLDAGKDVRLNVQMADRTIRELADRLDARKIELQSMRHATSSTPVVLGAALVAPASILTARHNAVAMPTASRSSSSFAGSSIISTSHQDAPPTHAPQSVVDVSAEKCGWDLTAYPAIAPGTEGRQPEPRHIEVKGRLKDQTTVCVTRNEILCAMNQADKFVLAIVLVDPDDDDKIDGPHYIRNPFDREPGWGVASINYRLEDLLARASP
jgi:hypothetical protein